MKTKSKIVEDASPASVNGLTKLQEPVDHDQNQNESTAHELRLAHVLDVVPVGEGHYGVHQPHAEVEADEEALCPQVLQDILRILVIPYIIICQRILFILLEALKLAPKGHE